MGSGILVFDSLGRAQENAGKRRWAPTYNVLAVVGGVLLVLIPVILLCYAIVAIVLGYYIARWDKRRRIARIHYNLSDSEVVERLALIRGVSEWLERASIFWHVGAARAEQLPAPKLVGRQWLRLLDFNVDPLGISVGSQLLLFLPDRLLVQEGNGSVGGIPYQQLSVTFRRVGVTDDGPAPQDSENPTRTYLHKNKDGGPDRRYNDNVRWKYECGEIALASLNGWQRTFRLSSPTLAEGAARVLQALVTRAQAVA
jgi:hypothetical protein